MKKQFYTFVLGIAAVAASPVFAQQAQIRPCDTYAAMEQVFANDGEARSRYEQAQAFLANQMGEGASVTGKMAAFEYTVPVVFHILHVGGSENISDATCISALDWVNKDFARLHADASSVAQPFEQLYIASDIKFMLAHKDPNGNPTTGIEHIYDTRTTWDRNINSPQFLFSGITWNPTKYLNIIIVKDIVASTGQQGVVVGYTYKPGTWSTGANPDAIVYNYGYLNGANARSLTHEIGHWLNLAHTFGDTNNPGVTCGDDGVFDTPPTKGNFSSCPSSQSGNTCAGATTVYAAGQQNTENFMDYSNCPKNFTQGQTTKMRNALTSSISNRQNLWQTTNLSATDVNGVGPCCPPIADFLSDKDSYTVCAGGSILMKNFSYNGAATSLLWSADNGATISTPTNGNTNILFPTAGISNVSLTATNGQGSSTKVRQVVVVDRSPGMIGPVMESFENFGLPANWKEYNPQAGSPGWDQAFPTQAFNGFSCYFLNNMASGPNQEDILETPIIDMSSSPEKRVTFVYAYARKTTSHAANFKVAYSIDCGGSWYDLFNQDANQLQSGSGGVTSTTFEPTSSSQWKAVDLSTWPQSAASWNNIKNSQNLILRFIFKEITGGGNNFYLDAVNLPGDNTPVGIANLSARHEVALYPNPSKGAAELRFALTEPSSVKVAVYNVLGGEVVRVTDRELPAGNQIAVINDGGQLVPGVYFVNLTVNGNVVSRKLVVE